MTSEELYQSGLKDINESDFVDDPTFPQWRGFVVQIFIPQYIKGFVARLGGFQNRINLLRGPECEQEGID